MNKTILIIVSLVFVWLASVAPVDAVLATKITKLSGVTTDGGRGTVNRLDLDKHQIVINGVSYRLDFDIDVRDVESGRDGSLDQLKVGSMIGFQPEDDGSGDATIKKILIFPSQK